MAVVVVLVVTMVDEPSRLPIVLPVTSPMWNKPAVAPTAIPIKEVEVPVAP